MIRIRPPIRGLGGLACVCAVVVLVAACSRRSSDTGKVTADDAAQELASFALAYPPQGGRSVPRIAAAQALVRAAPKDASAYVALAQAFLAHRRETGDAVLMAYTKDALNAALSLAPGNIEAHLVQSMMDFDNHRFAEAARGARRIIAQKSDHTTGYLLLSDALLELGRYEEAVDALQDAMDRYPDLRVHSRTSYLRWLHGDVEGALESMDDALKTGSRESEAMAWCMVELGMIHWHRGDLDAASAATQKARALVSDSYVPAQVLDARIADARGEPARAIELLTSVVEQTPSAEYLLLLAELLERNGDRARAAEYVSRADKLASHDPLPVALYYARHGIESQHALELAQAAVAERPTVQAHDVYALALWRAGRIADAAQAIERALALDTPDARLHLHLAVIALAVGDRPAAEAAWQRAQALNPHADRLLTEALAKQLDTARPSP